MRRFSFIRQSDSKTTPQQARRREVTPSRRFYVLKRFTPPPPQRFTTSESLQAVRTPHKAREYTPTRKYTADQRGRILTAYKRHRERAQNKPQNARQPHAVQDTTNTENAPQSHTESHKQQATPPTATAKNQTGSTGFIVLLFIKSNVVYFHYKMYKKFFYAHKLYNYAEHKQTNVCKIGRKVVKKM